VRGGLGGGGGGFGGGGGGGGGSSLLSTRLELGKLEHGATDTGNGLISISWENTDSLACFDQQVDVPHASAGRSFELRCSDGVRPGSFRILSDPGHGRLEKADLTNGTFSYVPDAGYAGLDSIRFEALAAGQVSAPRTVTFVIARDCLDRQRGESEVGIPPPSRNHRTPTAADTPACTAASSLASPRAIASQNRCRCSRRPAVGRPATASPPDPPDRTSASECSPQLLSRERCDDQLNPPSTPASTTPRRLTITSCSRRSAPSAMPWTTRWLSLSLIPTRPS
jgi:hypothetical protein